MTYNIGGKKRKKYSLTTIIVSLWVGWVFGIITAVTLIERIR